MGDSPNSSADKEAELTMCDVLEEQKELEDDANAVLGASDDKNCSYEQGYVPRQALYACLSCCTNEDAGVCLACCYACHDGHEVVELYTKRNFRCDCGNSKFADKKCSLRPDKEPLNPRNKYNHNFKGLYCNCNRPYPDLEDDHEDTMIQCVFCEDWYHGRHLESSTIPEDYSEMICVKCMESHSFLYNYLNQYDINIDVIGDCNSTVKSEAESLKDVKNSPIKMETVKAENGIVTEDSVNKSKESINIKTESLCLLENLKINKGKQSGAAFWPENWRKELCRCTLCMNLYCQEECDFLLNPEDTIEAYEERGKGAGSESQYDKGLSALSQLDRVKQMEAVRAYTSMKGELKEYLKSFADNKKTVRECDIREFFEQIQKKQKLNNGVPYFCR